MCFEKKIEVDLSYSEVEIPFSIIEKNKILDDRQYAGARVGASGGPAIFSGGPDGATVLHVGKLQHI